MNGMLVFGLATSAATNAYHIGTPGTPWGAAERAQWLSERTVSRSYDSMVRSRIDALQDRFNVEEYGSLSHDPERYPLFCLKSRTWSPELPNVLITGGVHGYETSGVLGALSFLGPWVCQSLQHSGRPLRESVGLRDGAEVECGCH